MKRDTSKGLVWAFAASALALGGCIAKSASNGPQTIRETGYLQCVEAAGCDGLLCTAEDGGETCEALPAACNGAGTCDCAGDTLCGPEVECRAVAGGLACEVAPTPDAAPGGGPDTGHDGGPPPAPDTSPDCVPELDPGAAGIAAASIVVGQTDITPLVVRASGCGAVHFHSLRVTGAAFRAEFVGPDGAALDETDPDPDGDGTPGLSPGATATLNIVFAPVDVGEFQGELVIESDAPPFQHRITLEGTAVACVDAVPTPAEVFTAPGVPVPLGIESDPRIGAGETFEWVVLTRPEGSDGPIGEAALPGEDPVSLSPDDLTTPEAVFIADLAGVYLLEFRPSGPSVCPGSVRVPFFAPAPMGLAAVVTWEPAPGSERSVRAESHLLAPGAELGDPAGDCGAGNPNPDWGAPGDASDDPLLGLDHGSASGTSAFALPVLQDTLAVGAPYRLVVTLPLDPPGADGQTGLQMRLAVYLDGLLVYDADQPFVEGGTTWDAAEFHFENGALRVVGMDPPI